MTVQDARTRILDCALGLMSEFGSAGTSMRRLAAASGLNVATIYHYFPSKADVLRAVIDERRYGERLASDEPPIDPDLPPSDRLVRLLNWIWNGILDETAVLRLLLGEGLRSEAAAQNSARALVETLEQSLTAWLDADFPELKRGPVTAPTAARFVFRQVLALAVESLATGTAAPDDAFADICEVLFTHPAE
jgi:AcrR family transcriptional regulator